MTAIPAAEFDKLIERFGHAIYEYDGFAEALYERELDKKKEAAPVMERPLFTSGVVMSSATGSWGEIDRTKGVRALYKPPANAA